jgi:hypothetical protein
MTGLGFSEVRGTTEEPDVWPIKPPRSRLKANGF